MMDHACRMCKECSIKDVRMHCRTCSPCSDAFTICDECGNTIIKPPILKHFEVLKLCNGCVEKKLLTY